MAILLYSLGQVIGVDGEFFKQLPDHAKIVFTCIVTILILALATKYVIDVVDKFRSMMRKKKMQAGDIKHHSFFSKCESWSKYKVNELHFGDDVRNKLFRAIISTKIQVMSEKAMNVLDNDAIEDMGKQCFQNFIFKLITDMHVETERQIRLRIIEMYPAHGSEIHELIMNHRTKGFNAFNQITDNYTERLVQIICESDIYCDNLEKYEMILDAFKSALGAAFPHIETTFKGFNGDLDEMTKKQ